VNISFTTDTIPHTAIVLQGFMCPV